MSNILYIDTTDNKKVIVSLNNKKSLALEEKAQNVLSLIDKLLKKASLNLKDIKEIKVNTGPGSYTGIRVGLSIANALAYALKIPVNGKELETEVIYQ